MCELGAIWIKLIFNTVNFKYLLLEIIKYNLNRLSGKDLRYFSFYLRLFNIRLIIFYLNIRYNDILIRRG